VDRGPAGLGGGVGGEVVGRLEAPEIDEEARARLAESLDAGREFVET